MTGYSVLTCRRVLSLLRKEGVLVPGTSATARLRVAGLVVSDQERCVLDAGQTLSLGLAHYRHARGFTQEELATAVGKSITTIGHAETGRVWQSGAFWERADQVLDANGKLVALYAAYRQAVTALKTVTDAQQTQVEGAALRKRMAQGDKAATTRTTNGVGTRSQSVREMGAGSERMERTAHMGVSIVGEPVACVTITWASGEVSRVWPPEHGAKKRAASHIMERHSESS
jgi:hypothetical protein